MASSELSLAASADLVYEKKHTVGEYTCDLLPHWSLLENCTRGLLLKLTAKRHFFDLCVPQHHFCLLGDLPPYPTSTGLVVLRQRWYNAFLPTKIACSSLITELQGLQCDI